MYTEIVKLIEGGLSCDKEKVLNYAKVLADNFEKEGNAALSKRIRNIISKKPVRMASLDSLSTKPVDIESRMDIVDISYPKISENQLILNNFIKQEIISFIDFYRKRDDLLKSGLDVSNTLLLYGPPGCGKTTVAQYISSITGLPLVTARLDGLVSSLLGSTSKNIRKIFDYASKRECILFLDEFDVLAKLRDDKNELGELKRVVNSLIQNIDNMNSDSLLIAATNHHELLDPAIWRRFTKVITLDKPNKPEIKKLLEIYLQNSTNTILGTDKRMEQIETAFTGSSHADIKTVTSNCIKQKIILEKEKITHCDILKELYIHKKHSINNENDFIQFLLENNLTQHEIHDNFEYSIRKIRKIIKGE